MTISASAFAHGALGVAIITGLLDGMGLFRGTMIAMPGIDGWRFTAPIFVGTRCASG